jgi:hypothetical protein
LAGDDDLLDALLPNLLQAALRLRRATAGSRLRRGGERRLLPAGDQPGWLGPGRFYRDDLWAVAGLQGVADLFERAGQVDAAATARADADALWAALPAGFAPDRTATGATLVPAGPDEGSADDRRVVANLVACAPLGLLPPAHPLMIATMTAVRRAAGATLGVVAPNGDGAVSPELTAALAAVELAGDDPRALERLDHLLGLASPTWAWPELVDAAAGTGAGGAGHHLPTTAAFLRLVRDLCVRDDDGSLVLLAAFPPTWRGQSLDVHGVPTRAGVLSYAVRWHGDRPALLWELEPHEAAPSEVRLRVPGLDRGWVGEGARGEALLAP